MIDIVDFINKCEFAVGKLQPAIGRRIRKRRHGMFKPALSNAVAAVLLASSTWFVDALAYQEVDMDFGRGPVTVYVPDGYDPSVPAPLVLLLHGYGGDADAQEAYMRFGSLVDEYGFLYAHPAGTRDRIGGRFWNATDVCCDLFNADVDDSAYLRGMIDSIKSYANIDEKRVYLVGHSNGGFMSHRMACDHSDAIAAIASLAGATWDDPLQCAPVEPVHVLQIHGTRDPLIAFSGGCFFRECYPGALDTVRLWAGFAKCDPVLDTSTPRMDLDASVPGDETVVGIVDSNCLPNSSVTLWAIRGGGHAPALTADFAREIMEYFLAHPKTEEQ